MTHTELKELRSKTGLSQKEFGIKLFKTRDSIAKYESGKFTIPAYMDILVKAVFNDYDFM
jgi:transcriptional regulator with XRE-family HTH domain